jgi:urate oxidase
MAVTFLLKQKASKTAPNYTQVFAVLIPPIQKTIYKFISKIMIGVEKLTVIFTKVQNHYYRHNYRQYQQRQKRRSRY